VSTDTHKNKYSWSLLCVLVRCYNVRVHVHKIFL